MIQTLEIFYSFQCPYSYLALDRLSQLESGYDIKVLWQPFSARAAGQNNNSSSMSPDKASYVKEDATRLAKKLNIPISFPEEWPDNEFDPERSIRGALIAQDQGVSLEYNVKMFDRWWGEGQDPNDQDYFVDLCDDLDINPNEFAGLISSSDTRERVRGTFRRGKKLKVFGTPTVIIGEDRFYGEQRIDDVEQKLRDLNLQKPAWA